MDFNGGNGAARRPWRGAGAGGAMPPPPPPKVYRVAPRDFRELVQRLTGADAPAPAPEAAGPAVGVRQAAPAHAAAAAHGRGRGEAAAVGQFDYAPWFSAPLLSPASMPAGLGAHHGNGGLL